MNENSIVNYIKAQSFDSKDLVYKKLKIKENVIDIVFSQSVSDSNIISDFVIRSIKNTFEIYSTFNIEENIEKNESNVKKEKSLKEKIEERLNYKASFNASDKILENLEKEVAASSVKKLDLKKDDLFYYIYSGFCLIIIQNDIIAVETKATLDRSIDVPKNETTLKGPKDAFIENYMTNIGLIRKRIKSSSLILDEKKVGKKSNTKIGIMYVNDVYNKKILSDVVKKIESIDIDGIIDSNYIVEFIENSKNSEFPTCISTERPDLVSYFLLKGRIAIVVENSPFVIVVPAFLPDFVNNIEDNFQRKKDVSLTKIIRIIAFLITIFTPALYVALITFNQESIPTDLLLAFTTQRQGIPFPAYIEAFLMILSFEILREGDYRIPNSGGSTLSIVGALILGDAAVSAGIVSPIMIIVIAITTISGLMFNDINMSNALRTWRIIFLIFASVAGIFGIGIGCIFFIARVCETDSFKMSYSYPIAPFNFKKIKDNILSRRSVLEEDKGNK